MRALTLFLILATAAAAPARGEILEPLQPGDRLDISNYAGEIRISTWEENRLRIVAEHRPGEEVTMTRRGSVLRVRSASWDQASDSLEILDDERTVLRLKGTRIPGLIIYQVTIPAWLPVEASGALTSVTVEGLRAQLEITLFQGNVRVHDHQGSVSVRTLAGETVVEESLGSVKIQGWKGPVTLRNMDGSVSVETTSGNITFTDHRGGSVEAETVAGSITYDGPLPQAGTVSLATHAGGIDLALPAETDAAVSVRTLRGTFTSEFLTGERSGKSFRFQIGSGRSILDLESFSGAIRIRRRSSRE